MKKGGKPPGDPVRKTGSTNKMIRLTNRQLIEIAGGPKGKVHCIIHRPNGETAFDEIMTVTSHPADGGKSVFVKFSLSGLRPVLVSFDDRPFSHIEQGYLFMAYPAE